MRGTTHHHQGADHARPRPNRACWTAFAPSSRRPASRRPTSASIIHGTTLATNAIIERKGARTALITTEGFRDVHRDGQRKPLRPVRPEHRAAGAAGAAAPAPAGAGAAGQRRATSCCRSTRPRCARWCPVLRREDVESIAVGFLHAFVNPEHERRVRDDPGARRCPTSRCRCRRDVSPEMREWERFSTTVANAYVQPLMARYLRRLEAELHAAGRRRAAVPDDVGRRADHDRDRMPLPDPPGGKRPGRRRDLLRPHRAANAGWTACCRSTWAAPRRRSA